MNHLELDRATVPAHRVNSLRPSLWLRSMKGEDSVALSACLNVPWTSPILIS